MVRLERYFAGANGDASSSSDVEWQDLPTEIWLEIAAFFYNDPKTLMAMAGTNKRLRGIVLNDRLWQGLNPETAVPLTQEEKQQYPEDQHLAIRTLKTWRWLMSAYHARPQPDNVRRVMLFTDVVHDGHVNLFYFALSKYEHDQSTDIDYVVLHMVISFRHSGFAMLRPQMWRTLARVMRKRELLNRFLKVTAYALIDESIRRDDDYAFDIYFHTQRFISRMSLETALQKVVEDGRFLIFKLLMSHHHQLAVSIVQNMTLPTKFQEWFADDEGVTFSRLVVALQAGEIDEAEQIWTTKPITHIIQSLFDENFGQFSFALFQTLNNLEFGEWEDHQITIKTASFFLRHLNEDAVIDQGLRRFFTVPKGQNDFWYLHAVITVSIDNQSDYIHGASHDVSNLVLPLYWRYTPAHVRDSLSQFIVWQQLLARDVGGSRNVPNLSAIRFIMSQGIQVPLLSFDFQVMADMLRVAIENNDVASLDMLTRIETGPETTIRHPYLEELSMRPDWLGRLLESAIGKGVMEDEHNDMTSILPALRWIFEQTTA